MILKTKRSHTPQSLHDHGSGRQATIETACAKLGLATRRLYSAAGHDAQNLARIGDAGMIFIPSQGGKSHRVDETSDPAAIERGANALLHTLLALAGE